MYYAIGASVSSLRRESTDSLIGERERANLVVRLGRYIYSFDISSLSWDCYNYRKLNSTLWLSHVQSILNIRVAYHIAENFRDLVQRENFAEKSFADGAPVQL